MTFICSGIYNTCRKIKYNAVQYLRDRGLCNMTEWDELRDFHLDIKRILQMKNKRNLVVDKSYTIESVVAELLKILNK